MLPSRIHRVEAGSAVEAIGDRLNRGRVGLTEPVGVDEDCDRQDSEHQQDTCGQSQRLERRGFHPQSSCNRRRPGAVRYAALLLEAARASPANNRLTQGRSSISSGCHCTAIRKRRSYDSSDSMTPSSDFPTTLSCGATVLTAW